MDAELRGELLRRMETDQSARRDCDPAAMAAADAENLPWLKRVIARAGWPGATLVGPDGAHAAWLLAQHADADPAFQRECLGLLTAAVAAGEATRRQLAYLTDRVLLAEGGPQEYGTQVTSRDGQHVPRDLRDPGGVDSRRASMDLEPLADYLRLFGTSPLRATTRLSCPGCGELAEFDPPGGSEPVTVTCEACGRTTRIRIVRPGQAPRDPAAS
ncbi:MAG: hypothetical protein JO345_08785 [Streptosporangiaceae bacterium]|nr:hypothetical protein [Streptosporangiaceae bacterium]